MRPIDEGSVVSSKVLDLGHVPLLRTPSAFTICAAHESMLNRRRCLLLSSLHMSQSA